MNKRFIYMIGSLRNPNIPILSQNIREQTGHYVYDDWYSAGPEADDKWRDHQKFKGKNFKEALAGEAAQHVFNFDKKYLDKADTAILVMPAGKSGHIEFGYSVGKGCDAFVLFEAEPDRFDVMYNFATEVFFSKSDLMRRLSI